MLVECTVMEEQFSYISNQVVSTGKNYSVQCTAWAAAAADHKPPWNRASLTVQRTQRHKNTSGTVTYRHGTHRGRTHIEMGVLVIPDTRC